LKSNFQQRRKTNRQLQFTTLSKGQEKNQWNLAETINLSPSVVFAYSLGGSQ